MPVCAGDTAGVAVLGTAAGEAVGMAGMPAAAAGDDTGKATGTAECLMVTQSTSYNPGKNGAKLKVETTELELLLQK
ncbi:UNVERIFIED_CONTAM: hypothetical protein FKN15_068868 [Acipenser sinensis]